MKTSSSLSYLLLALTILTMQAASAANVSRVYDCEVKVVEDNRRTDGHGNSSGKGRQYPTKKFRATYPDSCNSVGDLTKCGAVFSNLVGFDASGKGTLTARLTSQPAPDFINYRYDSNFFLSYTAMTESGAEGGGLYLDEVVILRMKDNSGAVATFSPGQSKLDVSSTVVDIRRNLNPSVATVVVSTSCKNVR